MRTIAALILTLTAVALVACGDDDDSGADRGPALSKGEWTRQADAICDAANERTEALGDPGTPEGVARIADDAKEIAQDEVTALRALVAPADVADAYGRMVDERDAMLDLFDDVKAAGQTGDQAKLEAVVRGEFDEHDDEALEIAEDIGLEECDE